MFNVLVPLALLVTVAPAGADDAPDSKPWKNESEVGVIISKGNTDVQTYSAKTLTAYHWDRNTVKATGGFLKSLANDVEQAKNWNLGLRYEYALSDRWSGFLGQSVEGDRFQNVRQRYDSDVGVKYYTIKEEKLYWFAEGGYRFTHENRFAEELDHHKLRAYTEAEKKFGTGTSAKLGVEYLPNLSEGEDWQLNGEASVSALMNSVFSLKTGYVLKYDNDPAAGVAKKTDHVVTTSLVAKF